MQASAGLFVIDFVLRPFFKIFQKMPGVMMLLIMCLYCLVAYVVFKSAFVDHQRDY
jgi:hypothetical protein